MCAKWRLLDTGVRDAAENMCLDKAVLEARALDEAPDTLRFLQFSPPAVLVGYHQAVDLEVRTSFCEDEGIDINRRLTGGGAIFFDRSQLGWEIIAGKEGLPGNALSLNELMCRGLVEALALLGVKATFRPVNDVEVDGRKISGTGGTESGGALLFQGTLLVDFDVETMVRALRIPTEKLRDKEIDSIRDRVTCLKWILGEAPPLPRIKDAIAQGFAKVLGVTMEEGDLTGWEQSYLDDNVSDFREDQWVHRVERPIHNDRMLYSVHKAPGGLIRTSLLLDDRRSIIKYVLITGDFFAFPDTTVLDLEATLKNCPVVRMEERVLTFFDEQGPDIPGVTAEDFVRAVGAAVRKRDLEALGLTPEEASTIHEVNDALEHLGEASVVLLPYCAKWLDCDLRYDEDCIECGGCTVGVAYELAHRNNMEPITIVNFEHLMAVLDDMRDRGVRSYMGCCCEPFFAKHWLELQEAGVSGLLIDVEHTSCYELDQEREAKEGRFEGQTDLNVDVLEKLFASGAPGGVRKVEIASPDEGNGIKARKADRRDLFSEEKGMEG
jgi:lipoate-protein ligase A